MLAVAGDIHAPSVALPGRDSRCHRDRQRTRHYEAGPAKQGPSLPTDPKDLLPLEQPEPKRISGAIEGEDLVPGASASTSTSSGPVEIRWLDAFPGEYSGAAQLWWRPEKAGETLRIDLPVKEGGEYEVIAHFVKAPDYAEVETTINDGGAMKIDLYNPTVAPTGAASLGKVRLHSGKNNLTLKTTGKNEKSSGFLVGLDAVN